MHILASDFDNTLMFYTGMKKNDLDAIKEFQNKGNLFGVCTGRTLNGVIEPSSKYDIRYDFYICQTGSLIVDKDMNIIFQKKIPLYVIKELIEVVGKVHTTIVVNGEMLHYNASPIRLLVGKFRNAHIIKSLDEIKETEVDACSFHFPKGKNDKAREVLNKINDLLGDKISVYQNNEHLDCTALHCSKGEAIEVLRNYFHVDEICGIGDSFNDLPMFEHVTYSFTFDYSDDEVKNSANYVVKSLNECIKFILNR